METAAQVSLYPLRQASLAPAIDEALAVFREYGLTVDPGAMSTLIAGDDGPLFAALKEAFRRAAARGAVVMTTTVSNACPTARREDSGVTCQPIGRVQRTAGEGPNAVGEGGAAESRIVVDPELASGLSGLEPGQHVMVVFAFHRSRGYELTQHPRGDPERAPCGVFALRSPHRPNPIGVTVVELVAVADNELRVRGLDAIAGTPVLDLKPA